MPIWAEGVGALSLAARAFLRSLQMNALILALGGRYLSFKILFRIQSVDIDAYATLGWNRELFLQTSEEICMPL